MQVGNHCMETTENTARIIIPTMNNTNNDTPIKNKSPVTIITVPVIVHTQRRHRHRRRRRHRHRHRHVIVLLIDMCGPSFRCRLLTHDVHRRERLTTLPTEIALRIL